MKAPSVYLHALGMINALGGDLDSIVPALAASDARGMASMHTGIGDAFVGSVVTPLELAPSADLARYDCRNNRLLLAALAQIAPAVDAARERYGAHRIGVVLGTSTSASKRRKPRSSIRHKRARCRRASITGRWRSARPRRSRPRRSA